ncbi:MAG: 16S rRNA (uracil(1498)-N(3))-methyltransferase [Elusimicrobiota bacterium]|jgi:16S rRNA (uracil1498-N3)-methyltransferase|nr:16S rRNA (uracil(1498)-N(3))-methyltransferase [Elusimicrobiota bacterium]
MPQYLAEINGKNFRLSQDETRHLKAARARCGGEIKIFDGSGLKYAAKIETLTDKITAGKIIQTIPYTEPKRNVHLYFSAVSRAAAEDLLDKCTQVGVFAFHPVISARSDGDLLKKWETKKDRWRNILISACKQCETPRVPQIFEPVDFSAAVQTNIPAIICYENEKKTNILPVINKLQNAAELAVFVGPEGGYAEEEIKLAISRKILPLTLGNNILRAETAATIACWAATQ